MRHSVSLLALALALSACKEGATVNPIATQSSPAVPSVSPSASHPVASAEWTLAASFGGEFLSVNDLTYGSGRYIAIGYDRDQLLPGQPIVGRVWLSDDGTSWELLPRDDVFGRAYLTDVVTAGDGTYLVFGRIEDASGTFDEVRLAIWGSHDGRSWHRTEVGLPDDLGSVQVAVGQKGYLLSGTRFGVGRSELWLSADARNWELVRELAPRNGPVYEDIQHIAAGAEGFVAAGLRASGSYVIASGDGREWFEAPNPPSFAAYPTSLRGDWIMTESDANGGVGIWFSPNGLDWNRVAMVGEGPINQVISVLSAGDRVYLHLGRLGEHPAILPAGVWSSSDGSTWVQVDLGAEVFVAAAASSGQTIVLAGGASFFVRLTK